MINVPPTPDHAEVDLGTAAGVTDRGLRHQRNEDAMALESEQTPDGLVVVAVVCDGVSSSLRPDEASRAAAQAALPVLLDCSHVDATRDHYISHLSDFLGEQNRSLSGSKTTTRREHNRVAIRLEFESG